MNIPTEFSAQFRVDDEPASGYTDTRTLSLTLPVPGELHRAALKTLVPQEDLFGPAVPNTTGMQWQDPELLGDISDTFVSQADLLGPELPDTIGLQWKSPNMSEAALEVLDASLQQIRGGMEAPIISLVALCSAVFPDATFRAPHEVLEEFVSPLTREKLTVSLDSLKRLAPVDAKEEKFRRLAATWKSETEATSSVTEMAMHPAYQQIIGMGEDAVPFILQELEHEIDHWFWALQAITGDNPVPAESRGKIGEMRHVWLRWGRRKGIL